MSRGGSSCSEHRARRAALALSLAVALAAGFAAPAVADDDAPRRTRVITDQDVRHVKPRRPPAPEAPGAPGAPGTAVTVSGLTMTSSAPYVLSGTVRNTGTGSVSRITMLGVALSASQDEVGRATVTLPGPIPPGAEVTFRIPIDVTGVTPPAAQVFVSGPVERVVFDTGGQPSTER